MLPFLTQPAVAPAYSIKNSLLFRGAQYLSRTPGVTGNGKKWTFSTWWRSGVSTDQILLVAEDIASASFNYVGVLSGCVRVTHFNASTVVIDKRTTAVLRDPTGWYHIVLLYDSDSSVEDDRVMVYINGVRVTEWASNINPSLGQASMINSRSHPHIIGKANNSYFVNGYLAETIFVDGAALPPSRFGKFDPVTLNWRPKLPSVSAWGTNGFYLGKPWDSADLGKDTSGRGNHWTPSGFAATDAVLDSPTNVYATLSPINKPAGTLGTMSNGNLTLGATDGIALATVPVPHAGKWMWEGTLPGFSVPDYGLASARSPGRGQIIGFWGVYSNLPVTTNGLVLFGENQQPASDGRQATAVNDIGVVAVDAGANKVWIGRNRAGVVTWVGNGDPVAGTSPTFSGLGGGGVYSTAFSISSEDWYPTFGGAGNVGNVWNVNFGQRPFATALPGFKALCTANLPAPSAAAKQPWKYYHQSLVVHDGTTSTFTLGWNPDPANGGSHTLFRVKRVNATGSWVWIDTVRGLNKVLWSDATSAEGTYSNMVVSAVASGVVTLGSDLPSGTYLVEAWRVSPEAGFNIVTYTGNGAASRTISHSLGATPSFIATKNRGSTGNWYVYHQSVGNTGALSLNGTVAVTTSVNFWNNTSPTSINYTVGNSGEMNGNGITQIAYVWSEVPGFSKFGAHIGNGSANGPFIYLGFPAAALMTKGAVGASGEWMLFNTARDPENPIGHRLNLNTSGPESVTDDDVSDILLSGVKVRGPNSNFNTAGALHVTAAWAAHPLGGKRVSPATAR